MNNYAEFIRKIENVPQEQRKGQYAFNLAISMFPKFAELARGKAYDCFYDDKLLNEFLAALWIWLSTEKKEVKVIRFAEFFKLTHDNWYPAWQLSRKDARFDSVNLVKVGFTRLSDGMYRVSVWGADDDGMERDFEKYSDARRALRKILKVQYVNKNWLKEELGFVRS